MGYQVSIEAFEGPLDLLLHLIKESKVDLYEIKISEVTQQYLDYIHAMEVMQLEIASEYLVMAATLIEIKSKSLLPKQVIEVESEYEEDTRESLIERLIEYKKYKEVTKEFRELEEERGQFYTKPPIDFSAYLDQEVKLPPNAEVTQLISAFEKLMSRHKMMRPLKTKIMTQPVSIESRMDELIVQLKYKKQVPFLTLFDRFDREYVAVTFLALLELVKSRHITITQQSYHEDIYIFSVEGDEHV